MAAICRTNRSGKSIADDLIGNESWGAIVDHCKMALTQDQRVQKDLPNES